MKDKFKAMPAMRLRREVSGSMEIYAPLTNLIMEGYLTAKFAKLFAKK